MISILHIAPILTAVMNNLGERDIYAIAATCHAVHKLARWCIQFVRIRVERLIDNVCMFGAQYPAPGVAKYTALRGQPNTPLGLVKVYRILQHRPLYMIKVNKGRIERLTRRVYFKHALCSSTYIEYVDEKLHYMNFIRNTNQRDRRHATVFVDGVMHHCTINGTYSVRSCDHITIPSALDVKKMLGMDE